MSCISKSQQNYDMVEMVDISMGKTEIRWRWDEEEVERVYCRPENHYFLLFRKCLICMVQTDPMGSQEYKKQRGNSGMDFTEGCDA